MYEENSKIINIKKPRESNLELLRIFSMLMIITSHYISHGATNIFNSSLSASKVFAQCMLLGNFGNWIFLLISGYFLVGAEFSLKKLVKLVLETLTYSIFFLMVQISVGGISNITIDQLIKSIMPIIQGQYWFVSAYILMYLLLPFLNLLVKTMNQKQHFRLLCIISLVWIVIPSFLAASTFRFNMILPSLIFFIAAYIKLYPNIWFKSVKANVALAMASYSIYCLSVIIFNMLGEKFSIFIQKATYLARFDSILVCLCSIGVFLAFKNLDIKYNKVINFVSSSTLGVYLIHENIFIRPFLWIKLFNNKSWYSTDFFVLHLVVAVLIVFAGCVAIDKIRIATIGKLTRNILNKSWYKIDNMLDKVNDHIERLTIKCSKLL